MSRQEIEHKQYAISIGWDRSFDTYFAQVEDTQDATAEEPLLWLGSEPGEYRDLQIFEQAFLKSLTDIGINDFSLNQQQLAVLQKTRDENPPGSGISEKSPSIRGLMDLFSAE